MRGHATEFITSEVLDLINHFFGIESKQLKLVPLSLLTDPKVRSFSFTSEMLLPTFLQGATRMTVEHIEIP